jgi:hypothetical protein
MMPGLSSASIDHPDLPQTGVRTVGQSRMESNIISESGSGQFQVPMRLPAQPVGAG